MDSCDSTGRSYQCDEVDIEWCIRLFVNLR